MPEHDPQKLEAFVHRALRELPAHRAPASLEARVFAALAAREQAPWWQRGWQAWPVLPRAIVLGGGVAASLVFAWLAFAGGEVVTAVEGGSWVQNHAPWLATLGSAGEAVLRAVGRLLRDYQHYFYAALAFGGVGYAALVGMGVSLYRNLATQR